MYNNRTGIIIVLLCVNMLCTVLISIRLINTERVEVAAGEAVQYILYIGINDKYSYEQVISTGKATEIVNNICTKYVEGYTVSHAKGAWVDEAGVLTQENTLVYKFTGVNEEQVVLLMDEVLAALNQNSILVERRVVNSAYYSGHGGV